MRHKPRNIALLSMLVMLVVGATASAASAVQFEWKVNGSPLASGSSREVLAKDKATIHLAVSVGGAKIEFASTKLKFRSGAKILGGKPGRGEDSLELEGVTVTKPANCEVPGQKIITKPLTSEIVEAAPGATGSGQARLLLTPTNESRVWDEFEMAGSSCVLKGSIIEPVGNVLAEIGPSNTEAKVDQLKIEPTGAGAHEYILSTGGVAKRTALTYAGSAATLTGEAELELVSKEVFGAF
jgi:hypothetical protein